MQSSFGRATAVCALALSMAGSAHAQSNDDWQFRASLYGYFPDIGGTTTFPPTNQSSSATVDIQTILDSLKFTFMGSFEASKGRWGGFADVVYMDVGNTRQGVRDFRLGQVGLPADVSASLGLDLKGWVGTLAGTYRMVADESLTADALFGARVLDLRLKLNWNLAGNLVPIALPDHAGTREVDDSNVDAIIGVKGRKTFGADHRWFVPYYLDIGTGQSRFTWQAYAGAGYSFDWGDLLAAWRYIDYRMKSGDAVEELDFNGPAVAVVFRW